MTLAPLFGPKHVNDNRLRLLYRFIFAVNNAYSNLVTTAVYIAERKMGALLRRAVNLAVE